MKSTTLHYLLFVAANNLFWITWLLLARQRHATALRQARKLGYEQCHAEVVRPLEIFITSNGLTVPNIPNGHGHGSGPVQSA